MNRAISSNRVFAATAAVGAACVTALAVGRVVRGGGAIAFGFASAAVAAFIAQSVATRGRGRDVEDAVNVGILLVAAALVPAAFDQKTLDGFNLTKFTVMVEAALAFTCVAAIRKARLNKGLLWRSGLEWPVLAGLGSAAASTVFSANPRLSVLGAYSSYDGLVSAAAFALLFFGIVSTFALPDVRTLVSVLFFGAGGLTVLYGVLQLHDHVSSGSSKWDWVKWGPASFAGASIWSTMGNPNHLAGFLAILLPIGLALFFVFRATWVRVLVGLMTGALLVELLQTTTRGAWVAAAGALGLLSALAISDIRRRPRLAAVVVAGLVAMLIVGGVALSSTRSLRSQLASLFDFSDKSTAVQRIELWKSAAGIAGERPIVGLGPDTFRVAFPRHQTAKFVELYGPHLNSNGPHNVFMNYLATQGIVGLTAFFLLLAVSAVRSGAAWRRLRRLERGRDGPLPADTRVLLSGLAAATLAYIVQASFNLQQIGLSFVFWVLIAALTILARDVGVPGSLNLRTLWRAGSVNVAPSDSLAKRGSEPSQDRRRVTAGIGATFVSVLTVLVALVLAWQVSRPHRADQHFLLGFRAQSAAVSRAGDRQQSSQLVRTALDGFKRAAHSNPWESAYFEASGRLYRRIAQSHMLEAEGRNRTALAMTFLGASRAAYEQALELRPDNARALAEYAEVLLRIAEREADGGRAHRRAISFYRQAIDANPWDTGPPQALASLLVGAGDSEGALTVVMEALGRRPADVPLLRQGLTLAVRLQRPELASVYIDRLREASPDDPVLRVGPGKS